jgi:hypothetical protein
MLSGATEYHYPNFVGVIDPLENLDDLGPEGSIHRVDLVRAIDLHMSDFIYQFDAERCVLRHASDPLAGKKEA